MFLKKGKIFLVSDFRTGKRGQGKGNLFTVSGKGTLQRRPYGRAARDIYHSRKMCGIRIC